MRPVKQAIYSSRTADKFVVRLPDGMRERIAETAREHHRSMNSEIIARLSKSLDEGKAPEVETPGEGQRPEAERLISADWIPQVGQLVRVKGRPGVIVGFTFHKEAYHVEVDFGGKRPEVVLPVDVKPVIHQA